MNDKIYTRKKLRLKYYDYSSLGLYFLTICVKDREPILSNIFEVSSDVLLGIDIDNKEKKIAKVLKYARRNCRIHEQQKKEIDTDRI